MRWILLCLLVQRLSITRRKKGDGMSEDKQPNLSWIEFFAEAGRLTRLVQQRHRKWLECIRADAETAFASKQAFVMPNGIGIYSSPVGITRIMVDLRPDGYAPVSKDLIGSITIQC